MARRTTHQGVDMAVGIVALQRSMTDPIDPIHAESLSKPFVQVALREGLVAMRGQQTDRGREEMALAISLNRSSLQHEVVPMVHRTAEDSLFLEHASQLVVLVAGKLLAPAIEAEVHHPQSSPAVGERQRHRVARPCVVVFGLYPAYRLQRTIAHPTCQPRSCRRRIAHHEPHGLISGNGLNKLDIGLAYLVEDIGPVGLLVGPHQHDGLLLCPLGQQLESLIGSILSYHDLLVPYSYW